MPDPTPNPEPSGPADTSPLAFPALDETGNGGLASVSFGMTLRDYYAGQIAPTVFGRANSLSNTDADRDACAIEIWRRTDAILRARMSPDD